jgi:hypothetical protein
MFTLNKFIVFIIIISLSIIVPVSATTQAILLWTKTIGGGVTAVDNSETGTYVFAGTSSGMILSYTYEGVLRWQDTGLNGSITKLICSNDGAYLVALSNANQTYYVNGTTGTIIRTVFPVGGRNVTDVGISQNGTYFATAGWYDVNIFDNNGNFYASNRSFGGANWTKIAFDPYTQWVVATNGYNLTFKWNISTGYAGWLEPNIYADTPTAFMLSNLTYTFPYRLEYYNTQSGVYNLSFIPNASITGFPGIKSINNGFYYNVSVTGNLSILNATYDDIIYQTKTWTDPVYGGDPVRMFSIYTGIGNVSIYYGNMSYKLPAYPVMP